MEQITERLYAEKVAELSAIIETQRALLVALAWVAGKGKRLSISKGQQRQADAAIADLEWRRLATGEIRITPIEHDDG